MKFSFLPAILFLTIFVETIFCQNDHVKSSIDSLTINILNPAGMDNSSNPFSQFSDEINENIIIGNTINVKSAGAAGDGLKDDTEIIQSILDTLLISVLKDGIGGTVFFPPGVYKISRSLKIPPRTIIYGSGAFTQEHAHNSNWSKNRDYNKFLPSVIRLAKNANCNIIEPFIDENNTPRYKPFESVIIERIALDGNRYEQTSSLTDLAGIYIPELPYSARSGMVIQNVLIFDVNGTAFYDGHNQNEFLLINVFARNNAANGFYIGGEDISMYRVASGENGLYGFYFKDRGAYKCIDLDSWGNKKGVVIENAANGNFFRLQCDINYEEGLFLKGAEDISFISSVFATNSNQQGEIYYSEIKLEHTNVNGYGPFGIKFIGCTIGSGNVKDRAKFGIEEISDKPSQNIIMGTAFKANEFIEDVVNDNVYKHYIIEGCTAGDYGSEKFEIGFLSVKKEYSELTPRHNKIFIDDVDRCEIVLPKQELIKIGKEYNIIKSSADIELTFTSEDNITIEELTKENNKEQKLLNRKIIFTGDRWLVY